MSRCDSILPTSAAVMRARRANSERLHPRASLCAVNTNTLHLPRSHTALAQGLASDSDDSVHTVWCQDQTEHHTAQKAAGGDTRPTRFGTGM